MAFTSKTNNSQLKMRGLGSTDANPVRVSSIILGDNSNNSTGGNHTTGTMDLRGGNVDIMATSIVLGQSPVNYVGVNNRNAMKETGNLLFDTGTIDTTGMIIANQATNLNGQTTGTVSVSGSGTLTIGANALQMANYNAGTAAAYWGSNATQSATLNVSGSATVTVAGNIDTVILNGGAGPATSKTVASNINITGGSVSVSGNITRGALITSNGGTATSTLKLDGGTLNMTGHSIGTNVAGVTSPLDNINLYSGTLKNVGGVNGVVGGTALIKNWDGTTAGTLILDGANTYSGNTQVANGTLKLAASCTINSSPVIDVQSAGALDVTAFDGLGGYTISGGKTLMGTGLVNGSVNVVGTLATGESPGILTIAGNVNLSGTDAVDINNATVGTGYDRLVVNGSPNTVALAGTLALTVNPVFIPSSDVFWIVVNNTSNTLSGTFGTVTGLPDGWTVLSNVDYDTTNLSPGSGNDVAIVAIPEPATLAMLIIAAGLCLMFKRFRNN
jgi:autotransporter-associated beta strand protein